jgi:hypothetical protein
MSRPISPEEMARTYIQALESTDGVAAHLYEPLRKDALARIHALFSNMSVDRVHLLARAVYAPNAYLNDSLKVVVGAEAIEAYLVASVAAARQIHFDFADVAASVDGPEYYLRWQMTLEKRSINRGIPVRVPGVSHFRFDARGRVLVQRDFWNTGSGFYEHIPVLGWLIRSVRRRL